MKRILSGIQTTGIPHLGNYLGALQGWSLLSKEETPTFFSLMDLHAITIDRKPTELRKDTFDGACTLLACGIRPSENCSIFVQSHVKQHSELCWILQCHSKLGILKRMTQFKEKAGKKEGDLELGLLVYPVLMAADILLYQTTHVPVGEDQVQHLEYARHMVDTFNAKYPLKTPLVKPVAILNENKKIMSLHDPLKKMSKSEPKVESRILLTDNSMEIRAKIKSATTDSLGPVGDSVENRPGISNLLRILAACKNISNEQALKETKGMNMLSFKNYVADSVVDVVSPIREEIERLRSRPKHVYSVLEQGKYTASKVAEGTMVDIRNAVGFLDLDDNYDLK